MHRNCFVAWEHADEFRRLFNAAMLRHFPENPQEMMEDGKMVYV